MRPRYFITGTDTGVGKTQVSCALLRLMVRNGEKPFAFKPFESGAEGDAADSVQLHQAAGAHQPLDTVCLYRLKAPLAPAMAAKLEGRRTSWAKVLKTYASFEGPGLVEGAGGLHVPLDLRHDVIDLMQALALPAVVVARAGLGTVNHTTLTLEALQRRRVKVAAVVLMQSTTPADPSVPHNRAELHRRFRDVPFIGPIGFVADLTARAVLLERVLKKSTLLK